MMNNEVKNLWKIYKNTEDYWSLILKNITKMGITQQTLGYNDEIYFAIFHNWDVVFIQDCKKSKVLLARDGYERIM